MSTKLSQITRLVVGALTGTIIGAQSLPNLFPLPNGSGFLETYNITAEQMRKEADKRGVKIITISYNGPAHDLAQR